MATRTLRTLTLIAGFAWLIVAGYGLRWIVDDDDNWELAYLILSMSLLVGATFSVAIAASLSRHGDRPRLRMGGLVVSGLGAVASIVAWALPLWMTLLGVGFAMITAASAPRARRGLALLAAGQLVGMAVLFAGIEAEVGRRDEWGDYPAAGGIAVMITAAITIVALFELTRRPEEHSLRRSGAALTLGASTVDP